MPIQANDAAREVPWRPGYRTFVLAGQEHGVACSSSLSVLEPGAGAPLHLHPDVDEILIVLEGTLDFRLGDERRVVGPGHTVAIPAGTPHGFTAIGPGAARLIGFLPRTGAIAAAQYLEGGPPLGADQK
jgi:quercetin dioxygenase-like cupin family protein